VADGGEGIVIEEIVDGDLAFVFLIGLGTMNFMLYYTGLGGIGPMK